MNTYLGGCLALWAGAALAADVSLGVGEIKDTRSNGKFFNELEIGLELKGESLAQVSRFRVVLSNAVDDTGRDLRQKEDRHDGDFKEPNRFGHRQPDQMTVDLKLLNPARKAATVRVQGEVQLFMPSLDPAAVATFTNLRGRKGQALETPPTKAAGIRLVAAVRDPGDPKPKSSADPVNPAQALVGAFSEMFSGSGPSVMLKLEDPRDMVAGYQVVDAQGKEIDHRGSSTFNRTIITLDFEDKLPADVGLKLLLKTDKALVRLPIDLRDVALP